MPISEYGSSVAPDWAASGIVVHNAVQKFSCDAVNVCLMDKVINIKRSVPNNFTFALVLYLYIYRFVYYT